MNLKPAQQIFQTSGESSAHPIQCISKQNLTQQLSSLTQEQQDWVRENDFTGALKTMIRIPAATGSLLWLGIGEGSSENVRDASAWLSQTLTTGIYQFAEPSDDLVLGWALGQYRFDRYKQAQKAYNQLIIPQQNLDALASLINGLYLTRDLINTPTNDMGPSHIAEVCKSIAITYGANFSETVDQQLLEKGYRTIYAVGQAAANRPRLIELTWGDETAPKITLVGKGVCFDTGGLDIKPSAGMRIMKKDMGGAAHALGLACMIMASGLNVRLRVLIPAVENSISDTAYRPGDIIKTYQGTTVEIDNTDAEGRLVLCDALTLACEEKPQLLLDFATLTGAARVAMGTLIVPFFTDNQQLVSELNQHAAKTSDPIWQLPLFEGYEAELKSPVADLSNMGKGPFGGAITAALFLKHFVDKEVPWAHFDLYGWNNSTKATCPEGGQSMAIQGIFSMLCSRYGSNPDSLESSKTSA